MSEELIQVSPKQLGRYLYYRIGGSTLSQLRKEKVIKGKFPQEISAKRPDGLVVLTGGDVKAVIEYKQPSELKTKVQIDKAIEQELAVAKSLCKLLIVTSGKKTIWINALNGERILSENGKELKLIFDSKPIEEESLSNEDVINLEQIIDKIDHSLTIENNQISVPEVLDPSQLAKTLWQKIWINTGKEPEKCLYNVVELFVFKFLSDVGVLRQHNNFSSVFNLAQTESSIESLKHYANTCRKEIRELFPKGEDGTTVINGTIFVNEQGNPNTAQASLFGEVLQDLQNYDSDVGSFKYINKEFKTRLYESFLRQNAGIRFLGQYFTPRNVVQSVVAMSDASKLKKGSRVCDPFCGVGGFLLELIAENKQILKEFEPKNGVVDSQITVLGYDKGSDEKEDERTIILAKANMLIYFSDLLVKYHSRENLKAFSEGAFNKVFHLLRSNLGTFGKVGGEPFDLILTNPPYVTSGSSSLKRAIDEEGLSAHYTCGGRGTESLAMEWIVSNLKADGQAIVVVPDGLLNQAVILGYLKRNCYIDALVSLPSRTFYSTPKKTYILALRKKDNADENQEAPVFTYLASEIGETRDAKRWITEKNNLPEMASLFNQFKGSPLSFKSHSDRCKIVNFSEFDEKPHWMVDRWWSKDERVDLGVENDQSEVTSDEYTQMAESAKAVISEALKDNTDLKVGNHHKDVKEIYLNDELVFSLEIGERVLKKDQLESGVPTYSANANKPFGFIEQSNLSDFSKPSIIWGIDGIFDYGYVPENIEFATTDHCGRLLINDDTLLPKYIYHALKGTKDQYGFDRTYRASLGNMRSTVSVKVPVNEDGEFDLDAQNAIAEKYERMELAQKRIVEQLELLSSAQVSFSLA